MWDLWRSKWQWDRFSPNSSVFLSISFHSGSPYLYIIWEMNIRPVGNRSSETQCRPRDMNRGNTKRTRMSLAGSVACIQEKINLLIFCLRKTMIRYNYDIEYVSLTNYLAS
jgi:hypothetical protein